MLVPPYGPLDAEYAIIGQSPGREEAERQRPFVGPAGRVLRQWLTEVGIPPDSCYWTNITLDVLLGSKAPNTKQTREGKERLEQELATLTNIRCIVLAGAFAARLCFTGPMAQMHGRMGKLFGKYDCIAVYHPSAYLRALNPRRRQELATRVKIALTRIKSEEREVSLPHIHIYNRMLVSGVVGLDTETDSTEARWNNLLAVGLWDGQHDTGGVSRNPPEFAPDAEPIVHNSPFDQVTLKQWEPRWHDSKMLAHLIGEKDTALKSLCLRYLGRPMLSYGEALAEDEETFLRYNAQDAKAHYDIFHELKRQAKPNILDLYESIERPMLRVYSRMTLDGVFEIDRPGLETRKQELLQEIDQLKEKVERQLGISNANSPIQVAKAFKLPNADVKALTKLQHPVADDVLTYRHYKKALSTYIDPWLKWPLPLLGTYWRPIGAWTGRPSSTRPNLQNVPHYLHKYLLFDGWEADLSQADIRIAAHVSQDPALLQAFSSGENIHDWAAREMRVKERRFAKIGVLATLYLGERSAILNQAAKFGVAEWEIAPHVEELQAALRRTFAGFFKWAETLRGRTVAKGLFGREHHVPPMGDELREWRELVAAVCQGGTADVLKCCSLDLEEASIPIRHMIHDSAFVRRDGRVTPEDIKEIMESAVTLSVPLIVEVKPWNPL